MALCRCLEKHSWLKGRQNNYIGYVKPQGYPNTAIVCGRCDNPGIIWLKNNEAALFEMGKRNFKDLITLFTISPKIPRILLRVR